MSRDERPDPPSKGLFASPREKRLWFGTLLVLMAIWATLEFSGSLTMFFSEYRRLLDQTFVYAFFGLLALIGAAGLTRGVGLREFWVGLAIVPVFWMTMLRVGFPERTHLFEYGLVAVLIHQALLERRRAGRRVRAPAIFAIIATALLGLFDETVQSFLPHRVYDNIDVLFNTLAAIMTVTASVALRWARDWDLRSAQRRNESS